MIFLQSKIINFGPISGAKSSIPFKCCSFVKAHKSSNDQTLFLNQAKDLKNISISFSTSGLVTQMKITVAAMALTGLNKRRTRFCCPALIITSTDKLQDPASAWSPWSSTWMSSLSQEMPISRNSFRYKKNWFLARVNLSMNGLVSSPGVWLPEWVLVSSCKSLIPDNYVDQETALFFFSWELWSFFHKKGFDQLIIYT